MIIFTDQILQIHISHLGAPLPNNILILIIMNAIIRIFLLIYLLLRYFPQMLTLRNFLKPIV